ncbi:type I secretion system permease/ATPase [Sphingomonas aracearum]|uniref:Type I secretion system permease/ATPase n=1 Tax=Sphingomonas aracearum TaxID=2283317 RepID=A0A369VSE2_9SPHN|nr:type I secretion system permease/ATPase [Sphingomonas aracearum]RDE05308.1 type I secretion system permease/ATPase [Sphingomonas aracearum]
MSRLGWAIARYRTAFITVAILSAVLNVLLLGGSLYMMMVYDSVLPSHSLPTLFSLLAMIVVVYLFQGLFDGTRSRILADVGGALDRELAPEVQRVITDFARSGAQQTGDGLIPMRDLDQIRAFLAGGGPAALIDLPWIIFFLGILFLLHYWLGVTALIGAIILILLTVITDRRTRDPIAQLSQIGAVRNGMAESNVRHSEMLTALGMRNRMRDRWLEVNGVYLAANDRMSRTVGALGGISKIFRMLLQSVILTVGALLVIDGKASGGVIFASSILSGRALAPVDAAIANWRGFAQARLGWKRLNEMLLKLPDTDAVSTLLPRPRQQLAVQQLVVAPPGTQRVTVQNADFVLNAGEALGIVGPSAAGKTSLGRAVIGIWKPVRGAVRLDGATLDQWHPDTLGGFIGYLPQTVELLDGTVAENIARFDPAPDSDAVIAAADAAGVHEMLVNLPQGYDTPVGADGSQLSAGQRQRIGLARALYKDPFLVLLDEPNSNLDAAGEAALERAVVMIRQRGGIAILIAHRPSALAKVSHVCFLRDGRIEAFGPRDEVLEKITAKPVPLHRPPAAVGSTAGGPPAAKEA